MSLRQSARRTCAPVVLAGVLLAGLCIAGPLGAAELPPSSGPLLVTVPRPLVGCDPVGSQVPSATAEVLSLVLPTAYVTTARGTITQAASFLESAEVHGLNPLVVVYTIKKQAQWSDGTPITGADFVATWHIGANGMGPAWQQYRLIKSISSSPNSSTVTVTFRGTTNAWQALFSPLLPARASTLSRTTCTSPTPLVDLSAGPSVIVDATQEHVTLTRNPSWWGAAPVFDPVVVTGPHTLSSPPASGLPLVVSQDPWFSQATLANASSNPGASSILDLSNRLLSLDFATSGANRLSPDLRLGLAGLLDRSALVASTTDGVAPMVNPATSHLISQGLPNYPTSSSVPDRYQVSTPTTQLSPEPSTTTTTDPKNSFAEAESHLRRAGFTKIDGRWLSRSGAQLHVDLGVPGDDRWAQTVAFGVILQLGAQGILVSMVGQPGSFEVAHGLQSSQFQMGLIARTTDSFPAHACTWFSNSTVGPASPLWAGFNDPKVNKMAVSAAQQLNAQDAIPADEEIDQRLWELMPSLPVMTEPMALVWSSGVDGVSPDPYPPGTLWWMTTWKLLSASSK